MNRRIVLVDQLETPDYTSYYGSGLGSEIYTLQSLEGQPEDKIRQLLAVGPTDAVMLVGAEPFKYFHQFYHYGVRSENYFDCSKLRRLSIEGGAFVKCVIEYPDKDIVADFMSASFTEPIGFPNFNQKVIHTVEEAEAFLAWADSFPIEEDFGYDYEGSGFPLDVWYELSGVSICTVDEGGFISLTDIRHQLQGGAENPRYKALLKTLGQWLVKRMDHVWTYNMQYEYQVSHRMLGVNAYNLCDASVVNVVEGNHLKKYSLKWSAQMYLQVNVWDTEFDRISDLIDQMLFTEEGRLKKDKHKVLKVDQTNFEQTPEWQELCNRYPGYIGEFKALLLEYWGNAFMCVPSEILGYYCNLDALHTLMIYKVKEKEYSKDCWQVNLDNTRLGCQLMSSGLYIDEPFRAKYETYCHEQMAWSITYCAAARCYIKMLKHQKLAANPGKYHPIALKLLEEGRFFNGDPLEITKSILLENLDTMDAYDTGLNEGALLLKYGPVFAEQFMDLVRGSMSAVKMKGKIDTGIVRKKKILGLLADGIGPLIGLDKIKIGPKHIELEKYMWYKRVYDELLRVGKVYLTDINHLPPHIKAFGQDFTLLEYSDYICDNYFQSRSPVQNDAMAMEFASLYPRETAYLTAMFESIQQLPETDKFYASRGIDDINVGFKEFMSEWENYHNGIPSQLYPNKVFDLAMPYWSIITGKSKKGGTEEQLTKIKETWTNMNGFLSQTKLFPGYRDQFTLYEEQFKPEDLQEDFYFMRKMTLNYLIYKKYAKMDSTYVGKEAMFKKNNRYVIEGPDHIPLRYAEPGEPGAVEKCFVHYEVNTKSSKRWSSAFHTIISHGDCKDVLCPPPVWDENGNIIYGGSNQILTYFDISSAEVKSAGYASGDPGLIGKFNAGEDIYIYSAKLYLGEEGWDKLDKKGKKTWRKKFKTIFLGVLYGLGKNSLAARLDSTVEEAEDIIQGLYKSFPKLREYVESQGEYPLQHDGYINTMLGDKLRIREFYDYLPKAKTQREADNIVARCKRLGVNLPIQGGTSSIMACGFMNNIRTSYIEGWKQPLQPIIVVHDSNTNYVPVSKIFDILGFYKEHYTKYCSGIGPGIMLLFDLLSGYSYETAKEMKQIDQDTIEYNGDAYSILKIYDKIMNCPELTVECDKTREEIESQIKMVTDPYDRFIRAEGCNMVKDESTVKVQFHRVQGV